MASTQPRDQNDTHTSRSTSGFDTFEGIKTSKVLSKAVSFPGELVFLQRESYFLPVPIHVTGL